MIKPPDVPVVATLADDAGEKIVQDKVTRSSKINAHLSLSWESDYATHTDCQFIDNINIWRDFFPPEIETQLEGAESDSTISHVFASGEILPEYADSRVHRLKPQQFNRNFSRQMRLEPRLGRFYPQGIFDNVPGNNRSNFLPSRIIGLDTQALTADFNHPLAARALRIEATIMQIWDAGQEHGGRCNDIVELLTSNGPGMQARFDSIATDFWSDDAFKRQDASADEAFYATPRLVNHLDAYCSRQIGELYTQLLPHDGRLLDLMSSWISHLPDVFSRAQIAGLGMNSDELEHNPMLAARHIHDLNQQPRLPFEDGEFDGILCTASIEYLVLPRQVFRELARVLKKGAPLVITFSNRWFPPKAIKAWGMAHEFERLGMVMEHFIEDGGFEALHSYTLRGLPRPSDDKYAGQLPQSDPVYAAWGYKR